MINDSTGRQGASDRGKDRLHDYNRNPRFPRGIGSSADGGGGGSSDPLSSNAIPEESEWINDPKIWDKAQEENCPTQEEDVENEARRLPVEVDFPYSRDENGNPILLVPNMGYMAKRRPFSKVEYDQSATHAHHRPDLGMSLPKDFDIAEFLELDRAARIAYAEQKLVREGIIEYQNEIAKSISPIFGGRADTHVVPGFAGVRKQETALTIRRVAPENNIIGIIRQDGTHISSFSTDDKGVSKLAKNNEFWVLKNRNL